MKDYPKAIAAFEKGIELNPNVGISYWYLAAAKTEAGDIEGGKEAFAIAEEKDLHECRVLKEYKVEGNVFRAFDGYSWYPLKWDQVRPTVFDREKYRRRLDRT